MAGHWDLSGLAPICSMQSVAGGQDLPGLALREHRVSGRVPGSSRPSTDKNAVSGRAMGSSTPGARLENAVSARIPESFRSI